MTAANACQLASSFRTNPGSANTGFAVSQEVSTPSPEASSYAYSLQRLLLLLPMFPSFLSFALMLVKAIAAAVIVTLRLALWHPKAYWYEVFGIQFRAPFRTDALSIPV